MSKILFTDIQIQKLRKNKWIKNITSKRITYTDDFKIKLVKECEDYKKFPQDVFREEVSILKLLVKEDMNRLLTNGENS